MQLPPPQNTRPSNGSSTPPLPLPSQCQSQNVKFTISTKNWNNEGIEAAWKPAPYEPERAWSVYGVCKTQAEQKMWEFVKEKKPGFVLNAVLPNSNMGKILSNKQPASTGGSVRSLYDCDVSPLKNITPQSMVNVKDTARLHVAALLDLDVENERILAFAHPFNCNETLACLRRMYPIRSFLRTLRIIRRT
ncbi:hypothetical protein ABVK25_008671 [Lepraria finkii]|uniref:Uncharacterized protein n=1 Tax=Lepraria finkii TaxID=1340010 RepID=A0ABR4B1I1_9LECA